MTVSGVTGRGYPFPGDSSAVDVPADIKALADAVNVDVSALLAGTYAFAGVTVSGNAAVYKFYNASAPSGLRRLNFMLEADGTIAIRRVNDADTAYVGNPLVIAPDGSVAVTKQVSIAGTDSAKIFLADFGAASGARNALWITDDGHTKLLSLGDNFATVLTTGIDFNHVTGRLLVPQGFESLSVVNVAGAVLNLIDPDAPTGTRNLRWQNSGGTAKLVKLSDDFSTSIDLLVVDVASGVVRDSAGLAIVGSVKGLVDGQATSTHGTSRVIQGSGWTAVRNSTGVYTITFTTAFAVAPYVEATAVDNGAEPWAAVSNVAAGSFQVTTSFPKQSTSSPNGNTLSAVTEANFYFKAEPF